VQREQQRRSRNGSAKYDPQALPVLFLSLLFHFLSLPLSLSSVQLSAVPLSIIITSLSFSSILILSFPVHYLSSLQRSTLALALALALVFGFPSPTPQPDGPKTYRGGLPLNSGKEWLGTGGPRGGGSSRADEGRG